MLKLATMFVPFAGLIQAIKTIWGNHSVHSQKDHGVHGTTGTYSGCFGTPAANGDADAAAQGVEAALAKGLTLAVGWLAKIAGLEWYW